MKALFSIFFCFITFNIWGQEDLSSDTYPNLKQSFDLYYFKENNTFYHLQTSLLSNLQYNSINKNSYLFSNNIIPNLKKIDITIELSKQINPKWHLGVSPKISKNNYFTTLSLRPKILHEGHIHKIQFIKEVGINFSEVKIKQSSTSNNGVTTISTDKHINATIDIGISLANNIKIKNSILRIMFSSKAYFIKEFDNQYINNSNKRFCNYTTFKLNTNLLIKNKIVLGIYGIIQNNYRIDYSTENYYTASTGIIGWEINYFLRKPNTNGNYSYIF